MAKWDKDEIAIAIKLIKNGYTHKQISIKLNRTEKSVQRKLNNLGYKSIYRTKLHHIIECKYCNKKFDSLISERRIFCCKKCQTNYLNNKLIRDYNKTKISKCVDCDSNVKIKINSNNITCRCKKCKNIYNSNSCKFCGKITNNKICSDCKPYTQNIKFFNKLNVMSYNTSLDKINMKAKVVLYDLYNNKKYSRLQISQLYNIDKKTLYKYFIKNNFKLRTLSESVINAVYQGRLEYSTINNQYKSGWHKTWNEKQVYYRSSYELIYCKFLDESKVDYIMEKLRIKYYDTILKKERIAIPDFYLPKTNEIIEIKSNWTFDEQNMKDKIIAYKNKGYKIKIILEHKEYEIHL